MVGQEHQLPHRGCTAWIIYGAQGPSPALWVTGPGQIMSWKCQTLAMRWHHHTAQGPGAPVTQVRMEVMGLVTHGDRTWQGLCPPTEIGLPVTWKQGQHRAEEKLVSFRPY